MRIQLNKILITAVTLVLFSCKGEEKKQPDTIAATVAVANPLPSWNEGSSKKAIVDFVIKTTDSASKDFIPVADRIACFDNDGTLWTEQPMYFQLAFALDQIKVLAPQHPEWKIKQPFKAVLEGDLKTVMAGGEKSLAALMGPRMVARPLLLINQ